MNKHLLAGLALLPTLSIAAQDPLVINITGYAISAEQALVPTEVLDRQAIEDNQGGDVTDLLRLANGLELGRNGGPGQTSALFFRGTNSNHNLVMVNGVPINSATVGSASLGTLDTQLLQRVEIISGPQSTLWGSGAIGGAINISTLPGPDTPNGFSGAASYGSNDTRRVAVAANHSDAANRWSFGIARQTTQGIPTLSVSDIDAAYRNSSFDLAAAHRFGNLELQAMHWQTQGTSDYLDFTYPAPSYSLVLEPVSQDFLTSASALSAKGRLFGNIDSTLQLSYARDRIDQNDSIDFAHTGRTTLAWRNIVPVQTLDRLTFGLEGTWEKAAIESYGSHYTGTTRSQAVFAQYDATRGDHQGLAGIRLLHHQDAGNHLTWNLGYGYRLGPSTRLTTNLATGFRYPTATERYVFSPNPDLKPETSRALELGIEQHLTHGQTLQLSLFRTDIDNLIVSTGVFPNVKNINIDQARVQGLEARHQWRDGAWNLDSSLVLQDPQDLSNHRQLLRRARVSAKTRLQYDRGAVHGGLEAIYSGKRYDVDGISFASTTTAPYALVNLFGAYDIDRSLQVFGRIENLFDRDYEVVSRYNTPGRSLYVGVKYQTD